MKTWIAGLFVMVMLAGCSTLPPTPEEAQRNAALNRQWTSQQAQTPLPSYYPSYSTPQVQGIPAQGTTTYNQVGDTLIGTDGTSCQTVGQTTICR